MKKKTHHLEVKVKHTKQNKTKIQDHPLNSQPPLLPPQVLQEKLLILQSRQQQKVRFYLDQIKELTAVIARQANTRSLLSQELNDLGRQMQEHQKYLLNVKNQYLQKSLQASVATSQIIQSQYFGYSKNNPEVLGETKQNAKLKKRGRNKGLTRSLQHFRSEVSLSSRDEEKRWLKTRPGLGKAKRQDR